MSISKSISIKSVSCIGMVPPCIATAIVLVGRAEEGVKARMVPEGLQRAAGWFKTDTACV